jgi:hypothetical protein
VAAIPTVNSDYGRSESLFHQDVICIIDKLDRYSYYFPLLGAIPLLLIGPIREFPREDLMRDLRLLPLILPALVTSLLEWTSAPKDGPLLLNRNISARRANSPSSLMSKFPHELFESTTLDEYIIKEVSMSQVTDPYIIDPNGGVAGMASRCLRLARYLMVVCYSLLLISALACARHRNGAIPSPPPPSEVLEVAPRVTIRYAEPWAASGYKYDNGKEIVRRPSSSDKSSGRILITTERRLSLADADRRLLDVSQLRPGNPKFYAIGGWPAVELRFREPSPTIEGESEDQNSGTRAIVDRAVVAVAADTTVLDFDIWLAPEAGAQVLDQAIDIARSAIFPAQGEPDETRRRVQHLAQLAASGAGQGVSRPTSVRPSGAFNPTGQQPTPFGGEPIGGLSAFSITPNPPGVNNPGFGELEIAASPNGQQIVIAANSGVTFSKDGGKSFQGANLGAGAFSPNDPSVTRGATGNFYLGGIAKSSSPPLCNDVVSRSTDGGASFLSLGFSAVCPPNPSDNVCFPDQPHIAAAFASSFVGAAAGSDQVYAVWRNMTPGPTIVAQAAPSCIGLSASSSLSETSTIACSTNSGVTFTSPPVAIPGGGDHPRVVVGQDGKVYTVTLSGSNILLTRFSSCANGLVPEDGFPVTVANDASVACPVPGLDRCEGDGLTSQMVATDPMDGGHLFVTYAEPFSGGELVVSRESHDGGLTYEAKVALSPPTTPSPRRFMPWSCSTGGTVFAGWYDRTAALAGARNDLTDYLLGGPIIPTFKPLDLTVNSDPQCASGWPGSVRDQSDSQSCVPPSTTPPGVCQNGNNTGNGKPCFFGSSSCPMGQSCTTGGGQPKYGDYNGIACSTNSVIAAWSSATSPGAPPLPPVPGITIFSTVVPLSSLTPTFDEIVIDLTTGSGGLRSSSEVTASIPGEGIFCLKPSDSNPPDGICDNGSGAPAWQDGVEVISQTFGLPSPLHLPTTMRVTLVQGTCLGCTSDNWNIEDISVTALDHTHTLLPLPLLILSGTKPENDNQSCVARLKDTDAANAAAVMFSLASPPSNSHTYVGGKNNGISTKCFNNGG